MELKSTMAGVVLEVLVAAGDEVSEGQAVLKLESMKMEIPVEAEQAGTVDEVLVAEGEFVNEGDSIIKLA